MTPDERASRRLAFTLDLARKWPEFRPPEHTPEEYGKAFAMAPLRFYRDFKLGAEAAE